MKGEKGDVFIGGKQIREIDSWEIVSYPEKVDICFTVYAADKEQSTLLHSLMDYDKPRAFRILLTEDGALTIEKMTEGTD